MSLGGAMASAVSALNAQSQQLAMISENLANSSTTGYKTVQGHFATLLSGQSTAKYSSGGVTTYTRQNVTLQGQIVSSSSTTDLAIDGNGMFAVSSSTDGSSIYYTRDGEFTTDEDGYLTLNNKYYLMGYQTDSDGNITSNSASVINLLDKSYTAQATETYTMAANLPADASTGATFSTSLSIYDSLGVSESVPVTWTKTASNTWTMSYGDPVDSDGVVSGTLTGTTSYTISFNSDGTLSTIDPAMEPTLTCTWNDGASDSSITLDLGDADSTTGLTQYASGEDSPSIDVTSTSQDGYAYGALSGITVGTDGTISGTYSNGQTKALYRIALGVCNNYNGLSAMSDNVYAESTASGDVTLVTAGSSGTGSIDSGALESSTTDISSQLSLMIIAQQAYSAASQVISTSKTMFDDLISVIR